MTTKNKIHTVYKTLAGERVPSVTTILGVLNKPALVAWAWQCGVDGLDYRAVRDNAADIGTLAHYLIMCHLKGVEPDVSEYSPQDVDKAENCLIKYWQWQKEHQIKPLQVEWQLVTDCDRYGGTIDFVGQTQDGEIWLVDHKTGKGIYPEMVYQLAAYRHLALANGFDIHSARILRIGREDSGDFEERVYDNHLLDTAFQIFNHCLSIYNLQKEIK